MSQDLIYLKDNQEFTTFRSGLIEHIFEEINKVFKSNVLSEKLCNLLNGAFLLYEDMKIKLGPSFSYSLQPHFLLIYYSAIFLICKVSISNIYFFIFLTKNF